MSSPQLPIRTERLVLRAVRPDDLDDMLTYYSDEDVARHLPFGPFDRTATESKVERLCANTHPTVAEDVLSLAIEHEGTAVGDLMLRLKAGEPPSVAEVGWVMNPAYGGRGLATEATRALLDLAFEHYGLHRVFAQLDPRNITSARLCERLGMTKEAHLRQDWFGKGEWTDTAIYGLLREEWSARGGAGLHPLPGAEAATGARDR